MLDEWDYYNDRYTARNRFQREMHKKTDLSEIGSLLDQMILEEKAQKPEHYLMSNNDEINMKDRKTHSAIFDWSN